MPDELTGSRLFLADGMALAYRAHFAMINRPLINTKGLDTSAIYGFVNTLIKMMEERPDMLAVALDSIDGRSFRNDRYPEYKANRPPMPPPLKTAIPHIIRLLEAFRIPVLQGKNVEADDVIGTIARKCEAKGIQTVIVSPDKDFRQLLSPAITIMRPAYRGEEFEIMTTDRFREEYGVEPLQFIDILALLGDSSDNVPGVAGIGAKTAPKLIQDYGSVENLLEHAEEIKGKRVREGLLNNRDMALLSKELVTIDVDVDIEFDPKSMEVTDPDFPAVRELFDELEFRTTFNRMMKVWSFDGTPPETQEAPVAPVELDRLDSSITSYQIVRSRTEAREAIARVLANDGPLAIKTLASARDPIGANITGYALSTKKHDAIFLPIPLPDGTSYEDSLRLISASLGEADREIVGHDLKPQQIMWNRFGFPVEGAVFDTMVAHYLIDAGRGHDLEKLARTYLRYDLDSASTTATSGQQLSLTDDPFESIGKVACEEVDLTLQLRSVLAQRLEKDGLTQLAAAFEFPLVAVLSAIEQVGVRVDTEMLGQISKRLAESLGSIKARIFEAAGREFNIGSVNQLREVLFTELGLTTKRKTPKGELSTNERVLSELAVEHEVPKLILEWRKLEKLRNTYVEALPNLVDDRTGRLHTVFSQALTATGRLSSSNPNLQNIPVRTGEGREIRGAFVPEDGFVLLSADYVQIELRILAAMSDDPGLRSAFESGEDVHTATSALIHGVTTAEVTKDMRRRAKEVNYGIPYGISPYELGQRLDISYQEAKELVEQYHRSYPKVSSLLTNLVDEARTKGYAETLRGRRRYLPDLRSSNQRVRSAAERMAVNMPIQGTQADMIKLAMIRIHKKMKQEQSESRMILQVHDELLFEVPPAEVESISELVREEMIHSMPIGIDIEVDIGVGNNWLEAH